MGITSELCYRMIQPQINGSAKKIYINMILHANHFINFMSNAKILGILSVEMWKKHFVLHPSR